MFRSKIKIKELILCSSQYVALILVCIKLFVKKYLSKHLDITKRCSQYNVPSYGWMWFDNMLSNFPRGQDTLSSYSHYFGLLQLVHTAWNHSGLWFSHFVMFFYLHHLFIACSLLALYLHTTKITTLSTRTIWATLVSCFVAGTKGIISLQYLLPSQRIEYLQN